MARFHEESGFDRLLVGHSSSSPDGFSVANQVLTVTSELGVLLAHRPGFVSPTVAARQYATLEAFHPGRVAMHIISGGDDADQRLATATPPTSRPDIAAPTSSSMWSRSNGVPMAL